MNKPIICILFSILFTSISLAKTEPTLLKNADRQKLQHWVDSVYETMSIDEKVGQLFMPIIYSDNRSKKQIETYVTELKVGGVLFSKGSLEQQAESTNLAQSSSKIPLLIALDGEWGLTMRLNNAVQYPRNMALGAIQNDSLIYLYGKEVARQCAEMGIHVNFAPTLDVNSNPNNPVIGIRSYSENPQIVAGKGIAYSRGLENGGVMSVAKHFPGHGDTADDSHKTLPTIPHPSDRLDSVELYPFTKYIEAGLSGMMIGHLNVPSLNTNGKPSSLSDNVGEKLLKEKGGFTGLVFTDGMAMKGVSKQTDMSIRALLAGNDIVLGVTNQEKELKSVKQAVKKGVISDSLLAAKVKKILTYKYLLNARNNKPIQVNGLNRRVNTSYAKWLSQKLYNESITLLKNESDLLPIKGIDKTRIASVAIGTSQTEPFQFWLRKYADVKTFQLSDSDKLADIEKELTDFDLVILSIHQRNVSDAVISKLIGKRKSIVTYFTSPYELNNNTATLKNANTVLLAYENTFEAQAGVAQAVFGGIALSGKIPVTAGGFAFGTGIASSKVRLSYQYPEEIGISSHKFDGIEKIVNEGLQDKAFPGCYVMVVKDGVVIYDRPFGKMEYDSKSAFVTDSTVYDLASVTKATATLPAVMKLYDEKKIRLLDPISKFVPQLKGSNKTSVTVREALFHESGITPFIPYYMSAIDENSYSGEIFSNKQSAVYNAFYAGSWGRTDYSFKSNLIAKTPDTGHNLPVADSMYVGKQMHDILLKDVIDSKLRRNKRYAYSCLNFMLLKEMIENISKEDINTFVQENFYRKLGAFTTTYLPLYSYSENNIAPTENDPFFRKQLIRGYVHDEGAALFGGLSGNAGLFSDANDLAKLYQMMLNGGEYGGERYLSNSTVRLFTTAKSSTSRRGLGFDKPDAGNTNLSPCSPLTPIEVYGHTGFTGTAFWIDPVNNMIYIFLSNRVFPNRSPNALSKLNIRERIQDEIYNAIK